MKSIEPLNPFKDIWFSLTVVEYVTVYLVYILVAVT